MATVSYHDTFCWAQSLAFQDELDEIGFSRPRSVQFRAIDPLLEDPLPEILERGWIWFDLGRYQKALGDLEYFVKNTRDTRVKQLVEEKLEKVRSLAGGSGPG